ncbi:GtrA family protein [Allokutzneria albata]|uniref:Putative flippase GtrA (Transmembrane translocase of bactoprenol-linked glucose) n=1 Tax=Allokutzneria albata TaxID=211114 RepID=A0A1H0BCJ6_ALLAB|nr:GtrA family protein [Allokutzneria albata]SDN43321.1 Putative flippase GtrA (transmembrane translocase of bactoprenol-linked glucose) [Allokutzneria albata]
MAALDAVLVRLPQPYRDLVVRHQELLKFAVVGSITFIVNTVVFYGLKWTILEPKPVSALAVAVIVATIVGYVLNREWSFRTRGGRERHHEAALYFLISGVGVLINSAPLYASRYWLMLEEPHVSALTQEVADFASGMLLGTVLAMVFRWWAFRKYVFPDEGARVVEDAEQLLKETARSRSASE